MSEGELERDRYRGGLELTPGLTRGTEEKVTTMRVEEKSEQVSLGWNLAAKGAAPTINWPCLFLHKTLDF